MSNRKTTSSELERESEFEQRDASIGVDFHSAFRIRLKYLSIRNVQPINDVDDQRGLNLLHSFQPGRTSTAIHQTWKTTKKIATNISRPLDPDKFTILMFNVLWLPPKAK